MAIPAATAAFDEPLPFDARVLALFDARVLPPLRLREDAEDVRLLAALPLLALPRDAVDLLLREAVDLPLREALDLLREAVDLLPLRPFELPLRLLEPLWLLGLDPFELRELVCRFDVERVLPWAIAPP